MHTVSTGQPSTLGTYRDLCKVCGFNKAAKYFEDRISESGEDDEVIQEESQMIMLVQHLESGDQPAA